MTVIKQAELPNTKLGNDPSDHRKDPTYLESINPTLFDVAWREEFKLTREEVLSLSDVIWIYPNLLIKGHLVVIPAPPNAGKTTVMMWLAGEIAAHYDVVYVNADIAGSDVKQMVLFAEDKGFHFLTPDMKLGKSMADVVEILKKLNETGTDFSGQVFIFDTLKKMTDVINKRAAKDLLATLRGLSTKGMTIILLAHTNKYKGADGKDIFEGTGDIKSDVDEMIYLESQRNADGSMTVSTYPDKVRNTFEAITFTISADREVSRSDFIDVEKTNRDRVQRTKDQDVVEAIQEAINQDLHSNGEIVGYCSTNFGIGKKRASDVLRHYDKKLWYGEKRDKNRWHYTLDAYPPAKLRNCETESPAGRI
jgi:archaellum biogenesis ATPase FlaH